MNVLILYVIKRYPLIVQMNDPTIYNQVRVDGHDVVLIDTDQETFVPSVYIGTLIIDSNRF